MGATDRETLAAEVLHELRQPLMGLKAWLQLWQEDASRVVSPATLLTQVERIEQILSDYQRLVHRQVAPKERLALEVPVRAAVDAFLRQARGQKVTLEVEAQPGVTVEGNARLLEQLVGNLVSNARDAALPQPAKVRVVVLTCAGAPVLRVADWGPGLSPDIKARLFEAWNSGKLEGHGLGLLVCRRIADEHGARLELLEPDAANLVPRPATVFQVTFPAAGAAATAARQKVLVVDDEAVVRVLLMELLGREYAVHEASTAEEALAALDAGGFDLVLADKNLPGLSGLELAARARAKNPLQKVMLMTGYPSLQSAQQAAELGLLDYLAKPFDDIRVVRTRVREALEAPAPALLRSANTRVDVYEDNPRVAAQIAAALTRLGLSARILDASAPAPAELPCAAILSWDFSPAPAAKGLAMLKAQSPGTPFVVLAEHLTTEAAIASLRAGAAACLPKLLSDADALARELARAFKLRPPTG